MAEVTYRISRAAPRWDGQGLTLRIQASSSSSHHALFLSSDQPRVNQQQTNDAFYIQLTTGSTFLRFHPLIYISILFHLSLFIPPPSPFFSPLPSWSKSPGSPTSPLSPVSSLSPADFVCRSLVAAASLGRNEASPT